MNYPKAFEAYWAKAYRHHAVSRDMNAWQRSEVKETAYLAWQAGRKYERKTYGKK